jgi:FkbM family methyltransferase
MKWIAGSLNHSCWLGGYEYAFSMAFMAGLRRGYTVYDLGANVGFYSLLASSLVGPEGRVISFEPVPRNLSYLRRHLKLNKVTNCAVWDAAVGRSDGTGNFHLGYDHYAGHMAGAGVVAGDRPKDYGAAKQTSLDSNVVEVRVISLDGLAASGQLPPPDVIKCDIEGAEYDALLGASATLTKHHPVIFWQYIARNLKRDAVNFWLISIIRWPYLKTRVVICTLLLRPNRSSF